MRGEKPEEKRQAGITYQVNQTFEYMGHQIPQADLYEMASKSNTTYLVKSQLAYLWLKQRGMLPGQKAPTTHRDTTQHATSDTTKNPPSSGGQG